MLNAENEIIIYYKAEKLVEIWVACILKCNPNPCANKILVCSS